MNVNALLLLAVVAASTAKLGAASRNLARGGGGLTFPYPDLGGAAAGAAGAAGALGESIWWFLQNSPGLATPTEDKNTGPATEPGPVNPTDDPNAGPANEPDFQLNAVTSQPAAYLNCDPGSDVSALLESSDNCHRPTSQLIFTKDCASLQNEEIEDRLNQLSLIDGWYASMDEACGGAVFYGADLTTDQIAQFRAIIGVRDIEPDEELVDISDGKSMDMQSEPQFAPTDTLFKSRLKKRGEPILQANARDHLKFLSYPDQMSLAKNALPGYSYFSQAGTGILVYVMDNGVNPANSEFATTGVIQGWIYSAKIAKTETEYVKTLLWKGHGSCSVSLVAGPKYGVAKNAKVIMVKNSLTEGGILNAFQKIINDLYERTKAGEEIAGYKVITLNGGYGIKESASEIKRQMLGDAILKLLNVYQVVVVVAAGGSEEEEEKGIFEMNSWPQLFSIDSRYSAMITVGAVSLDTGTKLSWSKGFPGVNVWAPGEYYCASGYAMKGADSGSKSGTSFGAAYIAGLAAYFLSLPGLGDQLRQSDNIPLAVLQHIKKLSQPRDPAYPSAWNGLNSLMPGLDYGSQL